MVIRYSPHGRTAHQLAADVEEALRRGDLQPGDRMAPIREAARRNGVSPATVAAAYRDLGARGIIAGNGRAGTRVRTTPPLSVPFTPSPPPGTIDLQSGGPDPALLPPPSPLALQPGSYGQPQVLPALRDLAEDQLAGDGLPAGTLAVVSGALDGVERVLGAWLGPGTAVAVEDPGFAPVLHLLAAMGLTVVPLAVDDLGALPASLDAALTAGCRAAVLTPRAQNPTGAAWDPGRRDELARVLSRHPDALVVEDDHAGPVSGVPALSVNAGRQRWATVRSVSKWLGPDLRVAVLVGDEATVARVAGRQALGPGWVSHTLQDAAARRWADPDVRRLLQTATARYAERRRALQAALAAEGIACTGRSGLTTWVPVDDEHGVTGGLLSAGWAVLPGARFRTASPPGIRIAFSTLEADQAPRLAADLARCLRQLPIRST